MPTLQVVSDLHLEFHVDVRELQTEIVQDNVDILVVAGDCFSHCSEKQAAILGHYIFSAYPNVVMVLGNHEYYGQTPKETKEFFKHVFQDLPNTKFFLLDNDFVEVEGINFVGGTLWFPKPHDLEKHEIHKWRLADFTHIKDFEPWVYEEHKRCVESFLRDKLPDSIIVTHHMPSYKSVHPIYENDFLNKYFASELDDLMPALAPHMWIHGHTHFPCDYTIAETRILCNPYGYYGWESSTNGFNPNLVVE